MAVCGNCGREGSRIRSRWNEKGVRLPDECPGCAPGTFDPQWKTAKGAMGWEAYPTMYRKIEAPDGGVGYEATDEMRADTEARLSRPDPEDEAKKQAAIEERRKYAASAPRRLSEAQIEAARQYWVPKLQERARRLRNEENERNLSN